MPLNDDDQTEFDAKIEDENVYLGPVEIGSHFPTEGASEIGSYAMNGPSEIGIEVMPDRGPGSYAENGPIEIGSHFPTEGASEIGTHYPTDGASEIGIAGSVTPFELFMMEPDRIGAAEAADRDGYEIVGSHFPTEGAVEIGSYAMNGPSEIGTHYPTQGASEIGAAVAQVIKTARDNRQPPPPMRAVDVDEPTSTTEDFISDVFIGEAAAAAVATGSPDPYPLLTKLMQRAGAGMPARMVRVDTEHSYRQFRTRQSPELSELSDRVDELSDKFHRHVTDPDAHRAAEEDAEDLSALGAEMQAVEDSKRIDLWMPKRFDGKVEAWKEGDFVCVSIALPGGDGEVRIATSWEPIRRCVEEMTRHAAEAGVPAATVVGCLHDMGCVLGAGTAIKEMAAAAPAILNRPEAQGRRPFMVRVEPKSSPALSALAMMVMMCKGGDQQACDEWGRLGATAAPQLKQAMTEALQIVQSAQGDKDVKRAQKAVAVGRR